MKPIFYDVRFIKSITDIKQKPEEALPEVAFAGRSNVGKSSLMNALFNRKRLVKTSSTPGKTQLINYFLVNEAAYFVDLPGYGYAKISNKVSAKWQKMIEQYLVQSKTLRLVCLLIDSRHPLQKSDAQMSDWLNYQNLPYIVVLTKTDKLTRKQYDRQIKLFREHFPDHHLIPFSVSSEQAKTQLSELIEQII